MLFKNNPVLLSQQAVDLTPLESAVVSVASQTHGAKCRVPSGGQVMKHHYSYHDGRVFLLSLLHFFKILIYWASKMPTPI